MSGKVSVITPVYNAGPYLAEALDSVLNQTYKNIEILAVDDGSSDDSPKILESYQKKYPDKIYCFQQSNQGASVARNVGLDNATGDYIAFQDSDDIWVPEKLEKQLGFLNNHPEVECVFANATIFNSHQSVPIRKYTAEKYFSIPAKAMFCEILLRNFIPFSSVVVRRSVFDTVDGFDTAYLSTQDTELLLRIAEQFRIVGINENLVFYRIHDSNISQDLSMRHKNSLRLLRTFLAKHPDLMKERGRDFRKRFARKHFDYGYQIYVKKDYEVAKEQFWKSMRYGPLNPRPYVYFAACHLPAGWIEKIRTIKNSKSES